MGISNFVKFFTSKFSENFLKNPTKSHISKTTRIWAAINKGKIRSPWEYPQKTQQQDWDLQRIEIFQNLIISKITRIWAAINKGKIRNPWEYPQKTQQQDWDLQRIGIFQKSNFLKKS